MSFILNGIRYSGKELKFPVQNRALFYGDSVFESMRWGRGKLYFWEDHYFRLMANMRIMRMEIPMSYSPEYLHAEVEKLMESESLSDGAARIRMTISRKGGGYYSPQTNEVDLLITYETLEDDLYQFPEKGLELDLYKDFYKPKNLLGNVKSGNAQLYILASIFKDENGLDECFLLNDQKELTEAISSNVFLVQGDVLITPHLESGCLKGIMRKQILELAGQMKLKVEERAVNPFELQKVDEVFLTNAIKGIQPVAQYRKKNYQMELSQAFHQKLKARVLLT